MKQLVLTGFTGPNHKYPLSEIAAFILANAAYPGKEIASVLSDLEAILKYKKGFGGSILLGLGQEDHIEGVVAVLPPTDQSNSTLVYFSTVPEVDDSSRIQLLRSTLKITRGVIQVQCDLSTEDKSWLPNEGYQFHHSELTISRTEG